MDMTAERQQEEERKKKIFWMRRFAPSLFVLTTPLSPCPHPVHKPTGCRLLTSHL
jgi:hypothetical protein